MNDGKGRTRSLALAIVGFELVLMVGLIIGVVGRVIENNEIEKNEEALYDLEITNFRQVFKNISKNSMKDIVFSVHDIVWLNTDSISEKVGAVIREDSVTQTYYKEDGVYGVSFLIDVPSLNQTYNVLHYHSDSLYNDKISSNYRTLVYCLNDDSNCKDRYAGKVELIVNKLDYK